MSVSLYNTNALALCALPTCLLFVTGVPPGAHHLVAAGAEARKPKLRRYNSHDTGSNMFSVADFENARLMRRNEIELKQRLARRQRNSANGSYGLGGGSGGGGAAVVAAAGGGAGGCTSSNGYSSYNGFCGGLNGSGDYSTGDSKQSKLSSSSSEVSLNPQIKFNGQLNSFMVLGRNPCPPMYSWSGIHCRVLCAYRTPIRAPMRHSSPARHMAPLQPPRAVPRRA